MRTGARLVLAVAVACGAAHARAQTMLDQQQRLIDLHDLLLDLPPVEAPGALRPWQLAAGVEGIVVPSLDGTTGGKRQITASDHTPLFPRPRLQLGLPAPGGLTAFVGVAYIPPLTLRDVSTHYAAAELGLAGAAGPLALGVRAHAVQAFSRSPVTDPLTRDTLETTIAGADASAGWPLALGAARLTPYAGAGVVWLRGRFRVSSDGVVLRSERTAVALHAGVRALLAGRWEAAVELGAYPGLLVHPNFRLAYLFDLGGGR